MGAPLNLNADSLKKLSKKIARDARSNKSHKIAILTFPYHDGRISSGSSIISERLTTYLFKEGMQVVERRLLLKILEEQKLGGTGVLDPTSAKELGKVLGVDAIITGTLIDGDDGKTEVNARMIHTMTGEILAAAVTKIDRIWWDRPRKVRDHKKKKEAVLPVEREPDEAPKENQSASFEEPPPPPRGKALNLSNESFPPSRRLYHSAQEEKRRKKFRSRDRTEEPEPKYDQGYDDGYYDAQSNNADQYQSEKKSEPYKYEYKPKSKITQQREYQMYKMRSGIRTKKR